MSLKGECAWFFQENKEATGVKVISNEVRKQREKGCVRPCQSISGFWGLI